MDFLLVRPGRRDVVLFVVVLMAALITLSGCTDSNRAAETSAGNDTSDAVESEAPPLPASDLIAEAAQLVETEWTARQPLLVATRCDGVSVIVDVGHPGDCGVMPENRPGRVQCPPTEATMLPISVNCVISDPAYSDDSTVTIEIIRADPLEFTSIVQDAAADSSAGWAVQAINDRLGAELGLELDGICQRPGSATAATVTCRAVTDDGRTITVAATVEGASADEVALATSGVLGATELLLLESEIAAQIESETGASPRVSCGVDLVWIEPGPTTLRCALSGRTTVTGATADVVLRDGAPLQVTWEGVATTALTDPIARLIETTLAPGVGEVVANCAAVFELLPDDTVGCTAVADGRTIDVTATVLGDGSVDVRMVGVIDESQRVALIADAEASIAAVSLSSFTLQCPAAPILLDDARTVRCALGDDAGAVIAGGSATLALGSDAPALTGWELAGVETGLEQFAETTLMDDVANNYNVTITDRDCGGAGTDDSGLFACTGHLVTDRIPSNFDLEFVGDVADGEIQLSRVNLILPADITVIDADAGTRISERFGTRVTVSCDTPDEPVPSRIPIPARDCDLLVTNCAIISTLTDFTTRQRDAAEAECLSLGAGVLPAKVWIEYVSNDIGYRLTF